MIVRIRHTLILADGSTFRAGSTFKLHRRYLVDAGRLERLALCDFTGRVVLPCVEPGDVEPINGATP